MEPDERSAPSSETGFELNRPVIVGLLYAVGFLNGVTTVIGVILAHVWRAEPAEEWERTHHTYLIRTFWFGLLFFIISGILTVVLIGFLLLGLVSLWWLARTINSLLKAGSRQPIPNPETLLF